MKMGFIFSGLFWGIVIILIGVSIIVKVLFHVEIPVVRIILGLVLIYFGLRIMVGGGSSSTGSDTVFGERTIEVRTPQKKYATVFGKSILDLSKMEFSEKDMKIKIDTVFGETTVLLGREYKVQIKGDAVFARSAFPDGMQANFGSHKYSDEASASSAASNSLTIKSDVVFGNLEFRYADASVSGDDGQ